MKKQLLTLGLCFALGTVDCADYNPPVHNSLTDEDPFADLELVDDRETDDFFRTVDHTSTSKPAGSGTQTSGTLLAPSMPTAAARPNQEPVILRRSKRTKVNRSSTQISSSGKVNQGSTPQSGKVTQKLTNQHDDPLADIEILDFAQATGCAALSPETASTSALAAASHTPTGIPQLDSLQAPSSKAFERCRILHNDSDFQTMLKAALDRKFFTVHENGTASCSRTGNPSCGSTRYRTSDRITNWKSHCLSQHLNLTTQRLIDSFAIKNDEQQPKKTRYRCSLCTGLHSVQLQTLRLHIVLKHLLSNKKV